MPISERIPHCWAQVNGYGRGIALRLGIPSSNRESHASSSALSDYSLLTNHVDYEAFVGLKMVKVLGLICFESLDKQQKMLRVAPLLLL